MILGSVVLTLNLAVLGAVDGRFVPAPDMTFARYTASAAALPSGDVLLYGPSYDGDAYGILQRRLERLGTMTSPDQSARFLRMRLAGLDHEAFHAVWLDNRHRVLAVESLARGTIDGATIHTREVVKAALRWNAAAVVFSHNHPSGDPEPSAADRAITRQLKEALTLVEVRVLDHVVVSAAGTVSLAQRGWC